MIVQFVSAVRDWVLAQASGTVGLFLTLICALVWTATFPSLLAAPLLIWALLVMTCNVFTRAFVPILAYMLLLIVVRRDCCPYGSTTLY